MREPTHSAVGTWSGGRFLHFGEPVEEDRLVALLAPGRGIDTVITADAYGAGEADRVLGRALAGAAREDYCLVGAVGHDVSAERDGPKGYPRFTDPRLRPPAEYGDYLRRAAEASLARLGVGAFDVLLLHNPDRTGYTHPAVWEGLAALRDDGLAGALGVAPGPANGFTLDLIDCFERFGELIDWAMIILNPLEPWPGELCLDAAAAHGVRTITRVVDYGGLFHDDVRPDTALPQHDHRRFRPAGWIEAGLERLERMRPLAAERGLTPLQLACAWNLGHPTVACVAPTLIQEADPRAKPIEEQRADLAALPAGAALDGADVAALRAIGDNTGSMKLKGAAPGYDGPSLPDRWPLTPELETLAARWGIAPERALAARA